MSLTKEEIVNEIINMSVLDVVELTTMLEKKLKISPNHLTGGSTLSNDPKKENNEEKQEYDVILSSFGTSKISVIKAVRTLTNLGLKEAKDLVDSVPVTIKKRIKKEEAEAMKKSLEQSGAVVKIE